MSTKIYDGKKMSNMSIFELNQFYKQLRQELIPIAQREYYKLVAKIAQSTYIYLVTGENICEYSVDIKSFAEKEANANVFNVLLFARQQTDELIKKTNAAVFKYNAESDADFDVSLCILPLQDKILCIPYANHELLFNALMKTQEFEEYGYWNNTDKPNSISESEWEQRKNDWNTVLTGIGVPRENGMVVKIVDSIYDVVHRIGNVAENIIPYLRNDHELCLFTARNCILQREFEKLIAEFGNEWTRHSYKCLRQAEKYVHEHQDELVQLADQWRTKIHSKDFFSMAMQSK